MRRGRARIKRRMRERVSEENGRVGGKERGEEGWRRKERGDGGKEE